jgi:hypothetical protein
MNFHQHFVALRSRFLYLFDLKNIRWSVFVIYSQAMVEPMTDSPLIVKN